MRRTNRVATRTRLKILEARKKGMTYEEIRRRYGVSHNTISRLTKGKSIPRYCARCRETTPEKLEEHHPDKMNHPTETIDLCANCHSEIHRKKSRPRKQQREQNPPTLGNPSVPTASIPTPPGLSGPQQHRYGFAQSTNYVPELPINPDTLRLGLALYSMDLGRQGLWDALWPRQTPNGSTFQEQTLSLDNFLSRVIDGGAATFFLWLGAKLLTS